jgi:putative Holliday junction resolvase
MRERGRRVAFDYGDSRIGVAVCDPDGILATPLPFISARSPELKSEILSVLSEYEPIAIYVGKPLHLSGSEGQSVAKVEKFVEFLETLVDTKIVYVDERMSTKSAQRLLHDAGKDSKASRSLIDSAAAVTILETGLLHED